MEWHFGSRTLGFQALVNTFDRLVDAFLGKTEIQTNILFDKRVKRLSFCFFSGSQ